jgi:hypothetical protein
VIGEVITSLPAGSSSVPRAMCTAAVPLEHAMQCFFPYMRANSSWNANTFVPAKKKSTSESMTSFSSAFSASP